MELYGGDRKDPPTFYTGVSKNADTRDPLGANKIAETRYFIGLARRA
jgi:hypothetical protein